MPQRGEAPAGQESLQVSLRLLGTPFVAWDGSEEALVDELPQRLLIYLALRRGWVERERIGEMLWPESGPTRRLANLRRVLGRAKALPWATVVEADKSRLRWVVATDVAEFDTDSPATSEKLALWRGPLLDGVSEDDEPFGHWLADERRRLDVRRRVLTLRRADELLADAPAAAADLLERLLGGDALDEEVVQRAIVAQAAAGRPTQARTAYRRFAEALDQELGLKPLDGTRRLLDEVDRLAEVASQPTSTKSPASYLAARDQRRRDEAQQHSLPPLVGRDRELELLGLSDTAFTLITGEAGIGKSRLVQTSLAEWAPVWLRGAPGQRNVPFAAVSATLALAADDPSLRARWQSIPANSLELISVLLHDSPVGPVWWDARAPETAERRARLVEAASVALATLAGDGVVVVDDLHDIDAASFDAVKCLSRAEPGVRVLATARRSELAEAQEITKALAGLQSEGLLQRVEIGPLSEQDLAELVEHATSGSSGRRFVQRLHAATGGNPLYALETLRFLLDAGLLAQDQERGSSVAAAAKSADDGDLPIPPTVRAAVLERVARLGDGARRVLESASLAVAPFTLEQVAPATALSSWLALEGLERSVQAGLVVVEAGGYRFAHELLRRSVADELGDERKALIERRLALSLERDSGSPALIAAHFDRAGRRGEALRWHRRAAEDAVRLSVPSVALEHLERATELAEADADLVEIGLLRAKLHDGMVDHQGRESALRFAEEAALRLAEPVPLARVALSRAEYAGNRGDADEALTQAERSLSLQPHGVEAARAHFIRARAYMLKGMVGPEGQVEEALASAEAQLPPGPSPLRGDLYLKGFFGAAYWRGDMAAAAEYLDVAVRCFEETDQLGDLAEALNRQGLLHISAGEREAALDRLNAGLAIAREVGVVWTHRGIILNLLKVHTDVADVASAAPLVEEGLALAHDYDTPYSEVAFLLAVGYVRYLQGDIAAAGPVWERGMRVAEEAGHLVARFMAKITQFHPYLRAGDLAYCRRLFDEAQAVLQGRDIPQLLPRLRIQAARLALAEGLPHEAIRALEPLAERDDLQAEEYGEIALVHALAQIADGDDEAALQSLSRSVDAPTFEVALQALALKLETQLRLGLPWRETADEVQARLASGRLTPFEAVDLLRALAAAKDVEGDEASAQALRDEAAARLKRLLDGAARREPAVQQRP
ncbi:MAG: AAA family ATPase [Trueperaceae bacterium]|nr:AAA family ATPase [Trueperaceae bacterium]